LQPDKEVSKSVEREKKAGKKIKKISFGKVKKVHTFAVPKQTGKNKQERFLVNK